MSATQPNRLSDPTEVVRSILAESMVPLDEPAFEKAREAFYRAYNNAYSHPLPSDEAHAHDEATREGLEAFLATYLARPVEPLVEHAPIDVRGVQLDVTAGHGPDWFAMYMDSGRYGTTFQSALYLRRAELRALRDRLDAIDRAMPEPEAGR